MKLAKVLVTVPQCLEILMLSPKHEGWRQSLKYVIFDEIHEIGEKQNGVVWEHLLTLINCPFVGLSATIGNPENFVAWLHKFSPNLEYVQHNDRSTDLMYSVAR